MKNVEFSYNQIESRMKIKKRDLFTHFLRCLNGNSFTSRERLQPIRILRNVSLKKTQFAIVKELLFRLKFVKKFAKISFFQLLESATVLVIFCFLIEESYVFVKKIVEKCDFLAGVRMYVYVRVCVWVRFSTFQSILERFNTKVARSI